MLSTQTRQSEKPESEWEICSDAIEKIESIVDEMTDFSGKTAEYESLQEQIDIIKKVCEISHYKTLKTKAVMTKDVHTAARYLIELIPLREIFKNKALADAFLSELLMALAKESVYENRQALQRKGIEQAKAQGIKFGKPSRPLPDNFDEVRQSWRGGQLTLREAAEMCGMPESTFYNAVKRVEKADQVLNEVGERDENRDAAKTKRAAHSGRAAAPVRHNKSPSLSLAGTEGAV